MGVQYGMEAAYRENTTRGKMSSRTDVYQKEVPESKARRGRVYLLLRAILVHGIFRLVESEDLIECGKQHHHWLKCMT